MLETCVSGINEPKIANKPSKSNAGEIVFNAGYGLHEQMSYQRAREEHEVHYSAVEADGDQTLLVKRIPRTELNNNIP
jgi:hypothetical protein